MSNLNSVIFEFFGKPKRSKKRCFDGDKANESVYSVDGDEMNIYFKCIHCKCAIAATYNCDSNLHLTNSNLNFQLVAISSQ